MPENRLSRPTPLHPTPCAPPRPTPPWGCPTPPRTPLSPWVPLGAPRGGAAGGKSWPKRFGPKLFLLVAFWPKIPSNGPNAPLAVPLSHTKCEGHPGRQTPTPTGALSVPIVGETHLGQAGIGGKVGIARVTGWKGCGRPRKAVDQWVQLGCRGQRPCEGLPE